MVTVLNVGGERILLRKKSHKEQFPTPSLTEEVITRVISDRELIKRHYIDRARNNWVLISREYTDTQCGQWPLAAITITIIG